MYPLKFHPILKSTIWGGERIAPFKRLVTDQTQIGESWEISGVAGDVSIVSNGADAGLSLQTLLERDKERLVGKLNYQCFGNSFPLLIKLIDARESLSIQVHPDDQLALERHNSKGKTEMWYVVDNDNHHAHLMAGFKREITPNEYSAMIFDNTICEALDEYKVEAGDVFYLPAGTIHSIEVGCFIAEIQQTSDITYRIFDYNRKDDNGNERELHTELSKEAIDYRINPDTKVAYNQSLNEKINLIHSKYFITSLYELIANKHIDYSQIDSFVIYICIGGACSIEDSFGNKTLLQAGETILFPAVNNSVNIKVDDEVKLLETYI